MTTLNSSQTADTHISAPSHLVGERTDFPTEPTSCPVRINDPTEQPNINAMIARRQAWGGDRSDEVWDGVYVMAPMASNEHQSLVLRFAYILEDIVGKSGLGNVYAGVNVSDREEGWEANYRVPDVAVFSNDTKAKNCDSFWLGGPEFMVEITSPYDQTHDKLPFYFGVGVEEVLIVNRHAWQLELYQRGEDALEEVGLSTTDNKNLLTATIVPFTFQLLLGEARPQIEVKHVDGTEEIQRWTI